MTSSSKFIYRPDIDGLRTIAVLAVVFYHAFPTSLPGGFVGVDIFFVISGFLITGILLQEIQGDRFSIKSFYVRRIKRLFPALLLMFVATMLVAWFMLLPHEFRQLGKHVVGGAGFVGNLIFWSEVGYFDSSSELKPLLHLWSLGVEEQFYFVWPLIIALAYKFRWNFAVCALVLMIGSFAVNLSLVEESPSSAFFLPHARFWELIAGGFLAYVMSRADAHAEAGLLRQLLALVGLMLLVGSILMIDPSYAFPGWVAIFPVLGSVLMIGTGGQTLVAQKLMATKPMVAIGLISYPLYLWHWPLLSFAHIEYGGKPPSEVVYCLLALTFALSIFTYRCVELPLKNMDRQAFVSKHLIGLLSCLMVLVIIAGGLIYLQKLPGRLAHLNSYSDAHSDWIYAGDEKVSQPSKGDGENHGGVLIFGDSFARQYAPRFKALAELNEPMKSVRFHTAAGCVPIETLARKTYPECEGYSQAGYALAKSAEFDTVVLASSWLGMMHRPDYYRLDDSSKSVINFFDDENLDAAFSDLEVSIRSLLENGKSVHIVLHPPGGEALGPNYYPHRLSLEAALETKELSVSEHKARADVVNSRLRRIAERNELSVIDPAAWFCSGERCIFSDEEGAPLYKDATHIRNSFAECCVKDFDDLVLLNEG